MQLTFFPMETKPLFRLLAQHARFCTLQHCARLKERTKAIKRYLLRSFGGRKKHRHEPVHLLQVDQGPNMARIKYFLRKYLDLVDFFEVTFRARVKNPRVQTLCLLSCQISPWQPVNERPRALGVELINTSFTLHNTSVRHINPHKSLHKFENYLNKLFQSEKANIYVDKHAFKKPFAVNNKRDAIYRVTFSFIVVK